MTRDHVVIANCGGFWGDDPTAARRQVEGGPVDYLVMDYLAEVTMAILQKQRRRDPGAGYAADVLTQLRDVLPRCIEAGVTIIANAGGVNPLACKAAIEGLAADLGLTSDVRVGVVTGDDIYSRLDGLLASGEPLAHMETGRPLSDVAGQVLSANVYLGATGVVRALAAGANVVITGRVTDTGLTLAPMIHEFGWAADDWDRLAAGIVAGHIIECGTQCTGGNFTDWRRVKDWVNLGFPLIEANADGSFVVTKHPGTGGLVSVHTVTEQLLYEMGSPRYLSPDCTARFDSIRLAEDGPDRVRVTGVRGEPPPEKYKVSVSFSNGYRAFGRLVISGPEALAKAERVADIVWECAGGRDRYAETSTQVLGFSACHPPLSDADPSEVVLQLGVRDPDERKVKTGFGLQVVPRAIGSAPGIALLADQGRPRASEVVGYWPALISRDKVSVRVMVGEGAEEVPLPVPGGPGTPIVIPEPPEPTAPVTGRTRLVPLRRLCLARSGDKGDTANIGLVARSPSIYRWMLDQITPEFVRERFGALCRGPVERQEVPNLLACNFLLHRSLGGGGTMSLLVDSQGKTYAQYLIAAPVDVDEGLLEEIG